MIKNRQTRFFIFVWGILLMSASGLFAEKAPSDLFLTSSVQENRFFEAASGGKEKNDPSKIEIQYLLEAVRSSSLTFIRNNAVYDGKKAAGHLRWKYSRLTKKVKTARDFIEVVASDSAQTGSPYLVKSTQGATYPLKDCLYNELKRLHQFHETKK